MKNESLNYLKNLEAESIFVIREAAAQFPKAAILFSGGKDSILVAWLARKAFYPAPIPFPLVHIDTGHNFSETIEFRDYFVDLMKVRLIVGSVQKTIDEGKAFDESGFYASRIGMQSITLLEVIEDYKFDGLIGGARRDEEKARAKERFFSHRDEFGQWNPKNQRPEIWNLYNGRKNIGEHFRIFPISNWTELDVWNYLNLENVPLPMLYFSHQRLMFQRDGMWLPMSDFIKLKSTEIVEMKQVRFRTIGDMTSTGGVISDAKTVDQIIAELMRSRISERGGRADDKRSENSMEDRKKEGYF